VKTALLLLAATLPIAAQPPKLVNANVDKRSASAGLESVFRTLLAAQPQPAWIAYTVPAARGRRQRDRQQQHRGSHFSSSIR